MKDALAAKVATLDTATLIETVRSLNLETTQEAILICCVATNELERRMTDDAFLALMNELESQLAAA